MSFLKFTLSYLAIYYILAFCFTNFFIFIVDKISIHSLIKNKNLTIFVFGGNTIIKFIFLIAIIISSFDVSYGIRWMYDNYKELKSWEVAGDYGEVMRF